ncbi:MAG: MFS transporter [Acidocella sp.]|nr:MFS transporter [Acidocella sp.]
MPSEIIAGSARTLLRHPPFVYLVLGRGFSSMAFQMGAVAMGWQIYAMTSSAFDLGLIGVAQFIPMAALTFIGGHAVDRYERKLVLQLCQIAEAMAAIFLAWGTFAGWLTVGEIFAAVVVLGGSRAFGSPASAALLPGVVPDGMLQKGTAISNGAFQTATIIGPAIGGFAYAISPVLPYALMAALWLLATVLNGLIQMDRPAVAKEPPTLASLFAGVGFVWHNPAILGTISLDLFAVLLGGATALLPIYARDILHTGPWGLGILRGAPAVGSLLMTIWVARHAMERRVGMRMFQAVIVFGLATTVFGISQYFVLSLAALFVMGASDTVSVIIRTSLVQLRTPDNMRGRVGAVNYLFIGASNNLGEFESGFTAALLGAVPAVILGGIGSVAVALLWMKLFPSLRDMERMEAYEK